MRRDSWSLTISLRNDYPLYSSIKYKNLKFYAIRIYIFIWKYWHFIFYCLQYSFVLYTFIYCYKYVNTAHYYPQLRTQLLKDRRSSRLKFLAVLNRLNFDLTTDCEKSRFSAYSKFPSFNMCLHLTRFPKIRGAVIIIDTPPSIESKPLFVMVLLLSAASYLFKHSWTTRSLVKRKNILHFRRARDKHFRDVRKVFYIQEIVSKEASQFVHSEVKHNGEATFRVPENKRG